jgi:hypothetical protein
MSLKESAKLLTESSYLYGLIIAIQGLQATSPPCPLLKRRFPGNPLLIIIYPTEGLEEEMVCAPQLLVYCFSQITDTEVYTRESWVRLPGKEHGLEWNYFSWYELT